MQEGTQNNGALSGAALPNRVPQPVREMLMNTYLAKLLGFFSSCFLAISLGKVIIFTKTVMLPAYLKDLPLLNSPLLNFPDFANIFLET